ncbi:hypothetical protein [Streptomyces plumbiresistens]|uniref:hypothetical protein n=1 Tax=Streptomyces plumbiresistens TaxID=511811 RepID=UPI003CD06FF2
MSRALAPHWVRAGHEPLIAGRAAHKADEPAQTLGTSARVTDFAEGTASADVVLMGARAEAWAGPSTKPGPSASTARSSSTWAVRWHARTTSATVPRWPRNCRLRFRTGGSSRRST